MTFNITDNCKEQIDNTVKALKDDIDKYLKSCREKLYCQDKFEILTLAKDVGGVRKYFGPLSKHLFPLDAVELPENCFLVIRFEKLHPDILTAISDPQSAVGLTYLQSLFKIPADKNTYKTLDDIKADADKIALTLFNSTKEALKLQYVVGVVKERAAIATSNFLRQNTCSNSCQITMSFTVDSNVPLRRDTSTGYALLNSILDGNCKEVAGEILSAALSRNTANKMSVGSLVSLSEKSITFDPLETLKDLQLKSSAVNISQSRIPSMSLTNGSPTVEVVSYFLHQIQTLYLSYVRS